MCRTGRAINSELSLWTWCEREKFSSIFSRFTVIVSSVSFVYLSLFFDKYAINVFFLTSSNKVCFVFIPHSDRFWQQQRATDYEFFKLSHVLWNKIHEKKIDSIFCPKQVRKFFVICSMFYRNGKRTNFFRYSVVRICQWNTINWSKSNKQWQ